MLEDKDFDKRFDELAKKLDSIALDRPFPAPCSSFQGSDQIDLLKLWSILWRGKWWVASITLLSALLGLAYSLSLPNMYKSEGVYATSQKDGGGALAGQLGSLAAMAGVRIGGSENNDIAHAIALIRSWPFLEKVIDKHGLKPQIMGVKGWNRETNELVWDEKIYDPVAKTWVRESPPGKSAEPSSYETYSVFSRMLAVDFDTKTSMLHVYVEHYSPDVAREWVSLLIEQINETFRARDISEAKKNISYLDKKISQTSIAGMQAVLYGMIETQMKTLMLAEVDDEYLVRSIIEPKVSELRSSPNRKIIILLAILIGAFLSASVVLSISISRAGKRG